MKLDTTLGSSLPHRQILLMYVTAGSGHRRAAEAIGAAIQRVLPQAQVRCLDFLEGLPTWLKRTYPQTYYLLVKYSLSLWAMGYALLDQPWGYRIIQPIRRIWNLWVARGFIQRLRENTPDIIITTHFFPADVISACKEAGWLKTPLVVVVTDRHPHRLWLARYADAIVVDTQQAAAVCQERGISPNRLHTLGIPIAKTFHEASIRRHEIQQHLTLDPQRFTILITGGGTAMGPFEQVVKALSHLEKTHPGAVQLLVVCGYAGLLVKHLSVFAKHSPMPMRIFGFVDTMPDLMSVSDLVVAKAGGLTVTEAIGCGLPLIFYHVIPGQERSNADYVLQHSAGILAKRPEDVYLAVKQYLSDPSVLERMRQAAKRLGRPQAAQDIVSQVILPLLERRHTETGYA